MNDERLMQLCIHLASNGLGQVAPNPMVGCVIVKDGQILSKGYHRMFGGPHAEPDAIQQLDDTQLNGATLYVNLEPCSHHGKTPPCTDLIIRKGIKKVIIGTCDPFPKVNGSGIEQLERAGIEVNTGVMEDSCKSLNKRFFKFHEQKRPYMILKWARTCDNFLAPTSQQKGNISWITGEESQIKNHIWRSQEQGILVGSRTVQMDNPALTVRKVSGNQPLRMVIDPKHRLKRDEQSTLMTDSFPLVVFNHHENAQLGEKRFVKMSFNQIHREIGDWCYHNNIQSVIVEGGVQTLQDFITMNYWDEARVFTGPVHFGKGVPGPLLDRIPDQTERSGQDILHIFYNR